MRRIALRADVFVCAVSNTYAEDRQQADDLRGICADVALFPSEPKNGNGALGRYESPAASAYVQRFLRGGRPDLVHLEGFYLSPLVSERATVPLLLVEQNVEYSLCANG